MKPITITVDNRLRIRESDLPMGVSEALRAEFQHSNPAHFKDIAMGFKYTKEPKVIQSWRLTKSGVLTLPRGGTQVVRQVFARHKLGEPDWVDERVEGDPSIGGIGVPHQLVLWDHQEGVVEAALARENCLVRSPTGSGKTTSAIALAVRCGLPTLVIVWSSNLFDQWVARLCAELDLQRNQIGQIRGSKRTLAPITVAMQQTLYANPTLTRSIAGKFGCVMADEVQRFAARTFMDVIDVFPARYRIGWSADETRKDRREFLIYDVFGAVAADISQDELVEKSLVHDVEVRVIPTDFEAPWYVRQMKSDEEHPDFNRLLEAMTGDRDRNDLIHMHAVGSLAFGSQVLMLTHRREHAAAMAREHIKRGSPCGVLLGGTDNSKEFALAVDDMRMKKLLISAGTYQAIGQGLDIPSVDVGIACTPIATNKQFFGQVRGRICRTAKGKTSATLYYLWDQHVFGIEPILNLKKWNKTVLIQMPPGNVWVEAGDFVKNEWPKRRQR